MISSEPEKLPFYSVIVPVFNGQAFIGAAIESVLAQSSSDWELIIVDDASSDMTPDILETYAREDSRIRVFTNGQNHKAGKTLNRGISCARGKWIVRLDADDTFSPHYLLVLRLYLGSIPPLNTFFSCWPVIMDETGRTILDVRLPEASTIQRMMKYENFLYHSATSFSKSLWEKVGGYPEDPTHAEDVGMWLRFIEREAALVMIPEFLVQYRIHSSNVTSLNDAGLLTSEQSLSPKSLRQNQEWKISLYLKQEKLAKARSEIAELGRSQKRLSLKNMQYYLLTFLPKSFVTFFMWQVRPLARSFLKSLRPKITRV